MSYDFRKLGEYRSYISKIYINMNDFFDDLINMAVRVMRDNATTSNKCPTCSITGSDMPFG